MNRRTRRFRRKRSLLSASQQWVCGWRAYVLAGMHHTDRVANQLNMCQALALRYITRNKGGFLKRIEEREKAIHCIQLEIDFIKADMALLTEERVALRRSLIAKLESGIKEIENEPSN